MGLSPGFSGVVRRRLALVKAAINVPFSVHTEGLEDLVCLQVSGGGLAAMFLLHVSFPGRGGRESRSRKEGYAVQQDKAHRYGCGQVERSVRSRNGVGDGARRSCGQALRGKLLKI